MAATHPVQLTPAKPVASASSARGWAAAAAVLMASFLLAASIYIAAHRLLWYDELFTVLIARLPNLTTILDGLNHADNNMPAPYFLLVHFFLKLFPRAEIAARLPSALAVALGLLVTYDCARRLTDGLHGLMAAAFLTCTLLPYYAYEARSYGIYFLFAALALWIWCHTPRESRRSAVGFGLVIFGGVLFHYYIVLCLVPFAVGEAIEWRPTLPKLLPSPKLLAGAVGTAAAVAVLARQIFGAKQYSAVFWSKPTLYGLRGVFSEFFPDGLFLLALVMIWIASSSPRRNEPATPMQPAERVGWFFLLIPFAGYVLALLVTNAFVPRYFIGMLPGVAIAFACWLHRHFADARRVSAGVLLILISSGVYAELDAVRRPEAIQQFDQQTETRRMLQLADSLQAEGKRYFVCSSGMLYVELNYYSSRPGDYRLFVPPAKQLEVLNTVRYAMGLGRFNRYLYWSLAEIQQHARETALIQPSETTMNLLKDAGLHTVIRYRGPLEVAYLE